jgi:hypothetical protein
VIAAAKSFKEIFLLFLLPLDVRDIEAERSVVATLFRVVISPRTP